jgi:hypothetical protein
MAKNRSIYFEDATDELISKRAEDEQISFSDLVRKAIEVYCNVDPFLKRKAGAFKAAFNIDIMQAISNLALSRIAQLEAKREVWGNTGDVLFEFSEIGDSFIQGEEAFKMLKNLYKQEYQQEKKRRDEEYNQFGTDKEILDKLKKQRGKK